MKVQNKVFWSSSGWVVFLIFFTPFHHGKHTRDKFEFDDVAAFVARQAWNR